jgi:hypothetical protein
MNRPILLGYQLVTGLSDTLTGALLMVAPALTLRLMLIEAPTGALVYIRSLAHSFFRWARRASTARFLHISGALGDSWK